MTVSESLLDSCATIFIRQRISLLYHTQNNTVIYQALKKNDKIFNFIFLTLDTNQIIYFFLKITHNFKFLVNCC